MRILITGGKGFIGYNLSQYLLEQGCDVLVLDNNNRVCPGFKEIAGVNYIKIDLGSEEFTKAIRGVYIDAVVHLASTVSVDECEEHPAKSFNNNISTTVSIAEFCKKYNIPNLIFASTAAIYLKEKNVYGYSKQVCEEYLKYCLKKTETKTTILRFFNVYGPNAHSKGAYAPVIEKFFEQKQKNQPLTLYYPGTQTRDFIHVKDLCSLIYKIIISNKSYQIKTFDVCSGKSIAIKSLAKQISSNIIKEGSRQKEVHESTSTNPQLVQKFFNWRPAHRLSKYINERLKNE